VRGISENQSVSDIARTDQRSVSQSIMRFSDGIMMPPLLDIHTHVPQHPIRGRFCEGIPADALGGKLLAGLNRNVFPAEARCSEAEFAEQVVHRFLADTLSHGVVGGAVYMTVSTRATEIALSILPDKWSVGLVLMNQNCPEDLRTDEAALEEDVQYLAAKFGNRLIVTDRFAVAVNTPLRMRAAALAGRFGLRTQTHLNEQVAEKRFVESKLYPDAESYTDVYRKDGLLDHNCILAHCIQMTDDEWRMVVDSGSVIAHCPTSNLLLESGVMPLDRVIGNRIPYALATDVGASPTCSMLAEMRRFTQVHEGLSDRATATEGLWRSTLAPAMMLRIDQSVGRLQPGFPASFIEVGAVTPPGAGSVETAVRSLLPIDPDRPAATVNRVTLAGKVFYERGQHA
jgi:guanine deaminase